jgi:hypothetical protein
MRGSRKGLSRAALAVASTLAWAVSPLAAQDEPSYSLGGTVEARPFARSSGSLGIEPSDLYYGQATSLGLELGARGERARAAASIEAALLTGVAADDAWEAAGKAAEAGLDSAGLLLSPAYAAAEAPPTLLVARVRALYLKLDYDWLSLSLGRQVVKYQRGALWSPTDPFTELDLSGISPVRRGSDALRLVFPLEATGTLDLVAAPRADFSRGRYAARLSGLVAGVEGAAIGYRDGASGTWNLGADFQADLLLGWNGEAVYSRPDSGEGWLRASGGADYSFGDFVVAAEYYYNGGGAEADPNAPGSHNAYASLAWRATDFLSLAASLVDGISERAWSAALTASLDAAQNAVLAAYARLSRLGEAAPYPRVAEAGIDVLVKF